MRGMTPLGPIIVAKTVGGNGQGGSGLTDDVKQALLQCFDDVVWKDDEIGAADIADLEAALYPAVSIAAVYTQSGTVYDTDSLDSLKVDLVVTATLEDGTQSVIPSARYTLSGTLTVGTSTITVTYRELTATFEVTVSTHLLYSLENRAFDTERIYTGVKIWEADQDWSIAMDVTLTTSPTSGNGSQWKLVGNWDSTNSIWTLAIGKRAATGTDFLLSYMGSGSTAGNISADVGRFRFVATHTKNSGSSSLKIRKDNGSALSFSESAAFQANAAGVSFGANTTNYALPKGTINKAEIYDIVLSAAQVNAFLGV